MCHIKNNVINALYVDILSHSIYLIYNLIFVNLYMIVNMFSEITDFFKENWVYILIVSFFILILNLNILIHDISFKKKPGKLNSIFVIENMENSPLVNILKNETGDDSDKSSLDKLKEREKMDKKIKEKKEKEIAEINKTMKNKEGIESDFFKKGIIRNASDCDTKTSSEKNQICSELSKKKNIGRGVCNTSSCCYWHVNKKECKPISTSDYIVQNFKQDEEYWYNNKKCSNERCN